MLVPKRAKYRKQHRGSMKGNAHSGTKISFGEIGLKSMDSGWVTSRQIEAARRSMTHFTQKGGRVWIRIFPDKPITKKPAETRMGSGKGDVYEYVSVIKSGRILFEMAGISKAEATEALRRAAHKLALKTRIVERTTV
jgi:large subunit ribosomal protein L16